MTREQFRAMVAQALRQCEEVISVVDIDDDGLGVEVVDGGNRFILDIEAVDEEFDAWLRRANAGIIEAVEHAIARERT